jgi:hypothetical protein
MTPPPPPELHQAGAPYDDFDAAAHPARPGPACTSPPPRQVTRQRALGELYRRRSLSFPSAAGEAEEPSVANPRDPLPFRPPCHLFVQEPDAPPSPPLPPSPHRRRVVPRARDAGAPRTARPCRGPRMPGPARVRARQRREAKPFPRLAASLLDQSKPEHAQPRHACATASPCASTPRRGRDVAFASRPSLL